MPSEKEIHVCPTCKGEGGSTWTDAFEQTNGYDKCEKCKGSGRILRVTTHKDEAFKPDERTAG